MINILDLKRINFIEKGGGNTALFLWIFKIYILVNLPLAFSYKECYINNIATKN